jgi:glycolate oxidase FAD binding subunit
MDHPPCRIDSFGPLPTVQPQSVPELQELVRRARAEGQAIYPLGGRTMLDYGLPPTRPGIGVDLRSLNQVIDYPARDMTVTVQAGITLAQLQDLLRQENQRLPVDVPCADHATLGGALATNVSGPRRYGYGTFRDYVIGITVVNDDGHEVKAGGRVVKNVAGYDLCKLYVGSLGTLGIITQVTLKLRPLPEERALIVVRCEANRLGPLLEELQRSQTRPVCIDLLNAAAARYIGQQGGLDMPEAPWVVVVGFEDNREAVCWQVQQLIKELAPEHGRGLDARINTASERLWAALVEAKAWPDAGLTFQANVLPSVAAGFCAEAAAWPEALLLQAHAGNGIVTGHAGRAQTLDNARAMLTRLQECTGVGGDLVVRRCPPAWKGALPIWGRPRNDAGLMRTIKQKLDPGDLFNPGRFVDAM